MKFSRIILLGLVIASCLMELTMAKKTQQRSAKSATRATMKPAKAAMKPATKPAKVKIKPSKTKVKAAKPAKVTTKPVKATKKTVKAKQKPTRPDKPKMKPRKAKTKPVIKTKAKTKHVKSKKKPVKAIIKSAMKLAKLTLEPAEVAIDPEVKTDKRGLLNKILNGLVSRYLSPSRENKRHNSNQVQRIVKGLLESITDDRFTKYYSKIDYVGSYYDNVRVAKADEFDFGVAIQFPRDYFKYDGPSSRTPKVFSKLKLTRPRLRKEYEWCLDQDSDYVIPKKIYNWFYTLIERALKTNSALYGNVNIMIPNEPAVTLMIELDNGEEIDVDLAIGIEGYGWPFGATPPSNWPAYEGLVDELKTHPIRSVWHLTCKPCTAIECPDADGYHYFRISVSPLEKRFLDGIDSDKGCRKDVLRLLKRMKTANNWDEIKSYYLKSLIMHYAYKGGKDYWRKDRMGDCFLDMMAHLKDSLEKPHTGIRSYFYPDRKLMVTIPESDARNLAKMIGEIIKEVKNDPEIIREYLSFDSSAHSVSHVHDEM